MVSNACFRASQKAQPSSVRSKLSMFLNDCSYAIVSWTCFCYWLQRYIKFGFYHFLLVKMIATAKIGKKLPLGFGLQGCIIFMHQQSPFAKLTSLKCKFGEANLRFRKIRGQYSTSARQGIAKQGPFAKLAKFAVNTPRPPGNTQRYARYVETLLVRQASAKLAHTIKRKTAGIAPDRFLFRRIAILVPDDDVSCTGAVEFQQVETRCQARNVNPVFS